MNIRGWLKGSLATAALAIVAVSLYLGAQALDAPPIATSVVTVKPGVTPDMTRLTYFSSDVRCYTCVRIEEITRRTVERHFAPEIANGRVAFQVINLDRPGNAHYVRDYRLISKTVIVSDHAAGEEVRWENLQQVWIKQRDEREFETYLIDAVRRHLGSDS
jgi:frataxin-like iron-binding protein CyaY